MHREGITFQWEQQRHSAGRALELPGEKVEPPQLAETPKQLRKVLVAKYDLELHLSSFIFAFVRGSLISKHKR